MKTRKILTALGLAIALTSSNPMISFAYSDDKLDDFEEQLEDYINKEIYAEKHVYADEEERTHLEGYYRYLRVQKLIHEIPTEYYYDLVDNINTTSTLKNVLKACIDDTMLDAAKEAIVYATIAENDQEVLNEIMVFFESRDNGNAFDRKLGRSKDYYSLKDIHVLDNREGQIDAKEEVIIFRDYTSYNDYRIYDFTDFSSYYGDTYYFITNQDNKILACVKSVDNKNCYIYLGHKEIYIDSLAKCLESNNLGSEIKPIYTDEKLEELNSKFEKNQNKEDKHKGLKKTKENSY